MYKVNHLALIAVFWSFALIAEEKTYEDIYVAEPFECLTFKGYNRFENSVQFKNKCLEKVDAYVCLLYSDGKRELKRSRRTIPIRGSWKLSADLGRTPKGVYWSSAPIDPEIPIPCR